MAAAPTGDSISAAVAAARGPAWAIDPQSLQILAANEEPGSEGLGHAGSALDAAMPGVATLRAAASAGLEPGGTVTPLVLWTGGGVRVLECRIERIAGAAGAVLVTLARQNGGAAANKSVDGASPPMDDAATLREIARRIRAGVGAAAGSGDEPVTSAAAARAADEATCRAETVPRSSLAGGRDTGPGAERPAPDPVDPGVLATLAHELKTPLSAIAAASEIMRDERLGAIGDERYRGYAADIHAGARHALAVVERLLAGRAPATTLPAGTPPDADSARRLTDLNEVAAECVSVLKPLADNARLELTAVLSRDPVRLAADATSLRQILINLLTNAIKFARRGDAVEVATRRDEAGAVSVEVRDTGPGMTRAEIARALDAGAEPLAAPRRGGGLGIGLPLVRQLAEANGGRLAIESVPGKGTRVQIEFGRGA